MLIENLDINKLTERDEQEVAGYYETLNLIGESYRDIPVAESSIFKMSPPGWATQDAMAQLVNWCINDVTTHALIKVAIFVYEFLSTKSNTARRSIIKK